MNDYSKAYNKGKTAREIEASSAAVAKILNSSELFKLTELTEKAKESLPSVLQAFVQEVAPYAEVAEKFYNNVSPYLTWIPESPHYGFVNHEIAIAVPGEPIVA